MPDVIPKNTTAKLAHRVRGNPPVTHIESAVSNFYPGLEFDLRGMWAKMFEGIVLHETDNVVMRAEPNAPDSLRASQHAALVEVTFGNGQSVPLSYPDRDRFDAIERGNAFAQVMQHGGEMAECRLSPRPPIANASSRLGGFSADATGDLFTTTSWVSQFRTETTDPNGDAIEFLEWDYGEDEQHELKSLRLFTVGQFSTWMPVRYAFKTRLKADDPWEPLATNNAAAAVSSRPGWVQFNITSRRVRFVRMDILELAATPATADGRFAAAVSEVEFDDDIIENLRIRPFFSSPGSDVDPSIRSETVAPGELTQSLCSPWLHDYRDCVCFYWASSRPDFVNVDSDGNGHNWTDLDRPTEDGKPRYRDFPTSTGDRSTIGVSYKQVFEDWETQQSTDDPNARDIGVFRFQIDGKDEQS